MGNKGKRLKLEYNKENATDRWGNRERKRKRESWASGGGRKPRSAMARRTESYCTCSLAGLATFLHYHSTSLNHAHDLHCRLFHALNLCLSSHVIQTCADTFMIILSFTVLLSLRIPYCYCYSLLSSVSSSVATSSITTFYHYYYKFPFSMPLIPEVLSERS